MYESPITIIQGQMETKMENDVMTIVQNYGIDVNKDALICALQYDRNQYDKGYADGKKDAVKEVLKKLCKIIRDSSVSPEKEGEEYFKNKNIMKIINIDYLEKLFDDYSCWRCPFDGCPDLISECEHCEKKQYR